MSERSRTLNVISCVLGVVLLGCLGICGGPPPPPPDACSQPSTGRVDTVELAAARIDPNRFGTAAARDDLPPRMLGDQSPLYPVRGGQGADMVAVRLVLRGSDVPPCIAQDTQVMVGGNLAARNRESVATYAIEGGARATKTIWLPGAFSGTATLSSDTVGKKPSLNIVTMDTAQCVGTRTCPCVHALRSPSMSGVSDAGRALYAALEDCRLTCDGGECEGDGGVCSAARRACEDDLY